MISGNFLHSGWQSDPVGKHGAIVGVAVLDAVQHLLDIYAERDVVHRAALK